MAAAAAAAAPIVASPPEAALTTPPDDKDAQIASLTEQLGAARTQDLNDVAQLGVSQKKLSDAQDANTTLQSRLKSQEIGESLVGGSLGIALLASLAALLVTRRKLRASLAKTAPSQTPPPNDPKPGAKPDPARDPDMAGWSVTKSAQSPSGKVAAFTTIQPPSDVQPFTLFEDGRLVRQDGSKDGALITTVARMDKNKPLTLSPVAPNGIVTGFTILNAERRVEFSASKLEYNVFSRSLARVGAESTETVPYVSNLTPYIAPVMAATVVAPATSARVTTVLRSFRQAIDKLAAPIRNKIDVAVMDRLLTDVPGQPSVNTGKGEPAHTATAEPAAPVPAATPAAAEPKAAAATEVDQFFLNVKALKEYSINARAAAKAEEARITAALTRLVNTSIPPRAPTANDPMRELKALADSPKTQAAWSELDAQTTAAAAAKTVAAAVQADNVVQIKRVKMKSEGINTTPSLTDTMVERLKIFRDSSFAAYNNYEASSKKDAVKPNVYWAAKIDDKNIKAGMTFHELDMQNPSVDPTAATRLAFTVSQDGSVTVPNPNDETRLTDAIRCAMSLHDGHIEVLGNEAAIKKVSALVKQLMIAGRLTDDKGKPMLDTYVNGKRIGNAPELFVKTADRPGRGIVPILAPQLRAK